MDTLTPAPVEPRRHRARVRLTALLLVALTTLGMATTIGAAPANAADPIVTQRSTAPNGTQAITWQANGFSMFRGKLTGNATVTMHSDGTWNFAIHARQRKTLVRNYAFVCLVTSRSGAVYSFEHHGDVGPRRGGGRVENWNDGGVNPSIRADWPNIWNGARVHCRMSGSWDVGGMFREMVNEEYVAVYIAVVGAVLAA